MTEVNLVKVQIEDLFLRQITVNLKGQNSLANLTNIAFLGRKEKRLGHLLGNRTPPLNDTPHTHILDEGADDARQVNPLVFEKSAILRGHKGIDYYLRNFAYMHDLPVFQKELIDKGIVIPIDTSGNVRAIVLERSDGRNICEKDVVTDSPHDETEDDEHNQGGGE
jgi:hypothetical protein